jgi:hypothetical protein
MFSSRSLEEALETLGEVLADQGQHAELAVIGGGSLLLSQHVASRRDQICFKLYASVDQGPQSKHTADLKKLRPAPEELRWAGEWCRTQDPSDGFAQQLELTLQAFGGSDGR